MKAPLEYTGQNQQVEKSLPASLEANELLRAKRLSKSRYSELINIKQQRKDRDSAQSKLFFFIGLTLSLLLVTLAINWKTYNSINMVDLGELKTEFEDIIEVPLSQQPPPPPPVQKTPVVITEVADDQAIEEIEIQLDVEMTEDTEVEDLNMDFTAQDNIEAETAEEIFSVVEQWPAPKGGMQAFYKYVGESIEYPVTARRLNVSGMVFVRFVVEKDGSITDVTSVKGIGAGCDEEAIRVVENAPAWNPGKQRGRAVRVLMTVPIRFILRQN